MTFFFLHHCLTSYVLIQFASTIIAIVRHRFVILTDSIVIDWSGQAS